MGPLFSKSIVKHGHKDRFFGFLFNHSVIWIMKGVKRRIF